MEKERRSEIRHMTMENIIIDCLRILAMEENLDVAVNQFLAYLGNYYQGNRTYIFEFDEEANTLSNTYEWCREGVSSERERLQKLPMEFIDPWMEKFDESGAFSLNELEEYYEPETDAYRILHSQGIQKLMAAPLVQHDEIVGFLGVDDPRENERDRALLKVSAYFVIEQMNKRRLIHSLEIASFRDSLTGLKNRTSYMAKLEEFEQNPPERLGVIFADVNGLKQANDGRGHEYGDRLLIRAARVMKEIVGEIVYRVGGDEFVVLYDHKEETDFWKIVETLKARFQSEPECDVSVGGAWQCGGVDAEKLISQADKEMYREKQLYYQMRGSESDYEITEK